MLTHTFILWFLRYSDKPTREARSTRITVGYDPNEPWTDIQDRAYSVLYAREGAVFVVGEEDVDDATRTP